MARGKKNLDPDLVCEIDLLTVRGQLEAIADGAPSPLHILQIARICEAALEQHRNKIPVNDRHNFDKSVRATLDHCIGITCILKGEELSLLRMREKGFIDTENGCRHLAEIDFVESYYLARCAQQAAGLLGEIQASIASLGSGRGRKLRPFGPGSETDWAILKDAAARLTPERGSVDAWCLEIRHVVIESAKAGLLDEKGSTLKELIDTHSKRLQRYAKRMAGSSPN